MISLSSSIRRRQAHALLAGILLALLFTRSAALVLPLLVLHAAWSLLLRWDARKARPVPYEFLGQAGRRGLLSAAMPFTGALAALILLDAWWFGAAALAAHLAHGVPAAARAFGWGGGSR